MGSRKNKTVKRKRVMITAFENMFQLAVDNENKLAHELKKANPKIIIVAGKDLKPGCSYTFIDPSVHNKDFTVKSITKDPEQGPKNPSGEQYLLTNEGWWIRDFPIGGNDKFIKHRCGISKSKSRSISKKSNSK